MHVFQVNIPCVGSPTLSLGRHGDTAGVGWGVDQGYPQGGATKIELDGGSPHRVANLAGKRETAKHSRRQKEDSMPRSGGHRLHFKARKAAQRWQHLSQALN